MTDEIRDTAFNTDYSALKTLNDEFDRVDEIKVEEINNITAVQNAFDKMYEAKRIQKADIAARIEEETAHLITPMIRKIEPSYKEHMCKRLFNE